MNERVRTWTAEQATAVNVVFAAVVLVVVASLGMCGCGHPLPPPKQVIAPVPQVTKFVVTFRDPVECTIPLVEDAPTDPAYPSASQEPDVLARAMVHRRDYEKLLVWARQESQARRDLSDCLEAIRERVSDLSVERQDGGAP